MNNRASNTQEHVDGYLTTLTVERRLSDHTIKAYRRDINKLLAYCDTRGTLLWQGLNNHTVRLFSASLNANGLHAKSIQRILSAGRGLCNYLVLNEH